MAASRKPRQKKTLTYGEFMAWLEGVEEMQPASWTPDGTQWKLIKSKLKTIVPEQVVTEVQQPQFPQPQFGGVQQPTHHPLQHQGLPPGIVPPPDIPSSIPLGQVTDNSNKGPVGMQTKTGANGEKVLKTPDIEGSYDNSQFS